MVERYIEKAKILLEALPYILRYRGKTFVIKFGGAAMVEEALKDTFAEDILMLHLLGIHVVVLHGGGPQIGEQLKRLGIESRFVGGHRVSDAETVKVVEEVLVGGVNKEIVSLISRHGGRAVGISGKDGTLFTARKLTPRVPNGGVPPEDLGFVGEVARVDSKVIFSLIEGGFLPVVAPVAADEAGATYNINADMAAGQLASALKAEKLILMTDVEGVKDRKGTFYSVLTAKEARRRIADGTIAGGMIPKVECCVHALGQGIGKAHVIDGRIPHAVLLEIFTDKGVGTEIHLAGRSSSGPPITALSGDSPGGRS